MRLFTFINQQLNSDGDCYRNAVEKCQHRLFGCINELRARKTSVKYILKRQEFFETAWFFFLGSPLEITVAGTGLTPFALIKATELCSLLHCYLSIRVAIGTALYTEDPCRSGTP